MKRTIAGFCVTILMISGFFLINPGTGSFADEENTRIITPENNAEVSGTIIIEAEVMACFCNAKSSLYIDDEFVTNGAREGMSDDGKYEVFIHEWDSTAVSDGTHHITVYGKHDDYYDKIVVKVDNNGGEEPEKNTRIISPENNSEVKGDVTITAEVLTCNCSGTTSLYVDGKFITEGTPGRMSTNGKHEIFIHVWDSTTISDGIHDVKMYGKHIEYSDEIAVIVNNGGGDEQSTIIKITSPEDNAEVEGVVTIKTEVLACFCNGKTSLYIDGKYLTEGTREGMSEDGVYEIFIHEWDSSSVVNGGHKITVSDKHDDYRRSITVFVNNDGGGKPDKDLNIVSHCNNDRTQGKIVIKAEVRSNEHTGPTSLYVNNEFISEGQYLGDVVYDGKTYTVYMHEWDSTEVEDGVYTIRIIDNDNTEFDEVQLHIENKASVINEEKTGSKEKNKLLIIPMAIIVLAGIIAILLLTLKKSK